MATTTISSGTVTGLEVSTNNTLDVVGSAVADSTVVDSGGTLNVSAGGVTSGSHLGDGATGGIDATENVSSGGTAIGTVVDDGYLYATSGGTAIDTTLLFGVENVDSGAVLSGATVSGGSVYLGGAATGIVLDAGVDLVDGGTESGTVVNGGLDEVMGVSTDTVVNSGGTQTILGSPQTTLGSRSSGTTVNSGGLQILNGGDAINTVVRAGGSEQIYVGNTASGLIVEAGGTATIFSANQFGYPPGVGIVADVQLDAGATLIDGGEALFTTAGSLVEGGTISGSGSVTLQGSGTITLDGQDTYTGGTVIRAGTLVLGTPGAAGTGRINFAGPARLQISGTVMPTNVIAGAAPGDTVDLASVAYQADDTVTVVGDAVTLHSFAGSTETDYVLDVAGASTAGSITLSADAAGGVLLDLPCYAAGTRILTARGEVVVEELRVGDLAMTLLGGGDGAGLAPVRWLGHRALDLRAHPDPAAVRPVRIRAGALGEGRPRRDLVVSPGHALFLDGVLVQAARLVNGHSVVQEPWERVTYWHVELERHDVLLAEGVPTESYLDTGNRGAFANGGVPLELHPDFRARRTAETCAPLVEGGERLERIKARVLERARTLFGARETAEPELHLLADGAVLWPEVCEGAHRFRVPSGCRSLRLGSRRWVPSELLSASTDTRTLGVCVRALWLDGASLALDDATLAAGWHAPERDAAGTLRWTAGEAALPAGARTVEVTLGGFARYWAEEAAAGSVAA